MNEAEKANLTCQNCVMQSQASALHTARRALAILEKQAAGYTSLTIPLHLQIELEDKHEEVAKLEMQGVQSFGLSKPENSKNTRRVELILEGEFSGFTPDCQHEIIESLARLLNTDTNSIRVLRVFDGSIVITFEMLINAAKRLYKMAMEYDAKIISMGIKSVFVEGEERRTPIDLTKREKEQTLIPSIEETGPLFQRLTKKGELNTRLKAVAALQRFGHTDILEKLASTNEWKRNDDLAVRKCAAQHLTKLDAQKAAKAWRAITEDTDIDILDRIKAAEQALANGEQYGRQFLLQVGTNYSGEYRLLAAQALIHCEYIEEGRSILILLSRDVTHDRHLAQKAFDELRKLSN